MTARLNAADRAALAPMTGAVVKTSVSPELRTDLEDLAGQLHAAGEVDARPSLAAVARLALARGITSVRAKMAGEVAAGDVDEGKAAAPRPVRPLVGDLPPPTFARAEIAAVNAARAGDLGSASAILAAGLPATPPRPAPAAGVALGELRDARERGDEAAAAAALRDLVDAYAGPSKGATAGEVDEAAPVRDVEGLAAGWVTRAATLRALGRARGDVVAGAPEHVELLARALDCACEDAYGPSAGSMTMAGALALIEAPAAFARLADPAEVETLAGEVFGRYGRPRTLADALAVAERRAVAELNAGRWAQRAAALHDVARHLEGKGPAQPWAVDYADRVAASLEVCHAGAHPIVGREVTDDEADVSAFVATVLVLMEGPRVVRAWAEGRDLDETAAEVFDLYERPGTVADALAVAQRRAGGPPAKRAQPEVDPADRASKALGRLTQALGVQGLADLLELAERGELEAAGRTACPSMPRELEAAAGDAATPPPATRWDKAAAWYGERVAETLRAEGVMAAVAMLTLEVADDADELEAPDPGRAARWDALRAVRAICERFDDIAPMLAGIGLTLGRAIVDRPDVGLR